MRARGRRRAQCGAESLEFVGVLPLVILVMVIAWQGVIWARQRAEAEADARTIARLAVLCPATIEQLGDVDAAAARNGGVASVKSRGGGDEKFVDVTVSLPPYALINQLNLQQLGMSSFKATVTMRQEVCG